MGKGVIVRGERERSTRADRKIRVFTFLSFFIIFQWQKHDSSLGLEEREGCMQSLFYIVRACVFVRLYVCGYDEDDGDGGGGGSVCWGGREE